MATLTINEIKQDLDLFKQKSFTQFKQGIPVAKLLAQSSSFMDDILIRLFKQFDLNKSAISMIAVGGYGRGELHPQSDIDLLFLIDAPLDVYTEERLSAFITFLWDCKLNIGHSLRTLDECIEFAKQDATIATNLLEARLLFGEPRLIEALNQQINDANFWPDADFYRVKIQEQRDRHAKTSAHDLEPNVKTGPGALRDLQTVTWITMRHFNAKSYQDLVDAGFMLPSELTELTECLHFLWTVRFALHHSAGRAEERLRFDLQPAIAELMGYSNDTQLAVEKLMKRYYKIIGRVIELNQMLLQLFKRTVIKQNSLVSHEINSMFSKSGKTFIIRQPAYFDQPERIIELFIEICKHPEITKIAAVNLRELRFARRNIRGYLDDNPNCRAAFLKLLRTPNAIHGLSLMHKHRILSSYFQDWSKIEGQMQFDLFHAYTVDEHTYRLLVNIQNFSQPERKTEFPLASVLVEQLPKPELLLLAALFHDIGKGRGGDHSEIGSEIAHDFCQKHGLNQQDSNLVAWLVQHHLLLSNVAQKQDINDIDVVNAFKEIVKDNHRLNYLFCLTVADICATNDKLWNSWKGSLMRELYYRTQTQLSSITNPEDHNGNQISEVQGKAIKPLLMRAHTESAINTLWQSLPDEYFLKHSSKQIIWHSDAILRHEGNEPLVLLSRHATRGATELFIYTEDKPQTFSIVMGELEGRNISVHDASIIATSDNFSLNTYVILEADGTPVNTLSRNQRLKQAILDNLSSDEYRRRSMSKPSRKLQMFPVPTEVNFSNSHRDDTTEMELITQDRAGVLARVGEALADCNIHLRNAKITTIGEKAEDIFYLYNDDNQRLTQSQKRDLKARLLELL